MNYRKNDIESVVNANRRLLKDFCIKYNNSIDNHIRGLYPDKLAISRYVKRLIRVKLDEE